MAQNIVREDVIKLTTETDSDGISDLLDGMSDLQDSLDNLSDNDAFDDLIDSAQEFGDTLGSRVQDGIDRMRNGMQTGMDNIKRNIQNSAEAIGKFGEKMVSSGKKVEGLGKSLAGLSTIAGGALGGMVAMASSFEDAMAKVNTIADTNSVSLNDLSKQIMDLSNQTGISANEIADATYNAISAGQSTADSVNFVSNATSLARAGFTDTASSIDILTTIMNAYGMEADKVGSVSDMLIQTQNKGKTTVAELASAMGKVIPTANSMGVGLEQLTAGYAIMTANGIATAETTTYMNSMLNELGKSTTIAGKALQKSTGKSFQELIASGKSVGDVLQILKNEADKSGTAFNEMWGSAEAGKAGLVLLTNGVDGYNNMVKQMLDSTGATAEALEKLQTPSQKAKVALNQVKNAGIELGTGLIAVVSPMIDKVTGSIGKITAALTDFMKSGDANALKNALGEALFGITDIANDIVAQIANVLSTSGTDIIKLVVEVIGKLISGIAPVLPELIHTGMEMINALIEGVATASPEIIVALVTAVMDSASALLNDIPSFINAGLHLIEGLTQGIVSALPVLIGKMPEIISALITILAQGIPAITVNGKYIIEALVNGIVGALPVIIQTAPKITSMLISGLLQSLPLIINCAVELVNALVVGLTQNMDLITSGAMQLIIGIASAIIQNLPIIAQAIIGIGLALTSGLIDMLPKLVLLIKEFIDKGLASLANQDWQKIGTDLIDGLLLGMQSMNEKVNTALATLAETAINAFKEILGIHSPSTVFAEIGINVIEGFINGINEMIGSAVETVVTVAENIQTAVVNKFNEMYNTVNTVFNNVKQTVITVMNNFKNTVTQQLNNIVTFWKQKFENLKNTVSTAFSNIVNSVRTKLSEAVTAVKNKVTEIVGAFSNVGTDLYNKGSEMIQGLINGITSKAQAVTDKVREIANSVKNALNIGGGSSSGGIQGSGTFQNGKEVVGTPAKHADGGLITSPHFGLVGEAGPEMIIPLSQTKRDSSISMWAETGEMLGVTNGTSVYEPSEMRAGDVNTHTENNTYAPVFNLSISGNSDRSMERKVKQWIRESMEDMFESVSRQNPRLREV